EPDPVYGQYRPISDLLLPAFFAVLHVPYTKFYPHTALQIGYDHEIGSTCDQRPVCAARTNAYEASLLCSSRRACSKCFSSSIHCSRTFRSCSNLARERSFSSCSIASCSCFICSILAN